jgi:hypothetical protein
MRLNLDLRIKIQNIWLTQINCYCLQQIFIFETNLVPSINESICCGKIQMTEKYFTSYLYECETFYLTMREKHILQDFNTKCSIKCFKLGENDVNWKHLQFKTVTFFGICVLSSDHR